MMTNAPKIEPLQLLQAALSRYVQLVGGTSISDLDRDLVAKLLGKVQVREPEASDSSTVVDPVWEPSDSTVVHLVALREVIPLSLWRWAKGDKTAGLRPPVPTAWLKVFLEQRASVWVSYIGDKDMESSFEWLRMRELRHDKGDKV